MFGWNIRKSHNDLKLNECICKSEADDCVCVVTVFVLLHVDGSISSSSLFFIHETQKKLNVKSMFLLML